MKEQYKSFLNKSIWVILVLFMIRCFVAWKLFDGGFSGYDLYGYAGEAIGVGTLIMCLYEKWIWRWMFFEKTPKLEKKYIGTFISNFDQVEREATLIIKQSLLFVHVEFRSGESISRSLTASIDDIMGVSQLTYCYLNTPDIAFRDRSEIHYGTAMLRIVEDGNLVGEYFTDRNTCGDMVFHKI